jgi:hypothetical protein
MSSRVLFLSLTAFWLIMNVWLWRAEYGASAGGEPVPVDLVWRKIMTAPDASSLSIFQHGQRSGFCEISTSVEQEMARLDDNKLPSEGVGTRAGYQIHLNGNTSLGDFTNRLRFDGWLSFAPDRAWRELNLKVSSHEMSVNLQTVATNQTVILEITDGNATVRRVFTFADLQNPDALLRSFTGNPGGGLFAALDLPTLPRNSAALAGQIHWTARRDHLQIGREPVSVYRLETHLLGNSVVIYTSTLGEILRIEIPGGFTAMLDEWSRN